MNKTEEILTKARYIIESQEDVARDIYYDPETDCYCTIGAICKASGLKHGHFNVHESVAATKAMRMMCRSMNVMEEENITIMNDTSTKEDVVNYFTTAIDLAKELPE
jgi:hypothetical protein